MKKRLTDKEKVNIINLYNQYSLKELSRIIKRPVMTIKNFHDRWLQRGYISNKRPFNRPKLNEKNVKEIKTYLTNHPDASRNDIINDLNLNVVPNTLSKYLRRNKIRYSLIPQKPKLSKKHIQKRLEYAKQYENWTKEDWRKVVFLDETSVILGKAYKKKAWKKRGEQRFFYKNKDFCISYFKAFSFISFYGKGELVFVQGKWNSDNYIDILNKSLIGKLKDFDGKDFYLVQDQDRCHISKKTMEFIKDKGVNTLNHPPNSPDLNPIENCWFIIKKRLSKRTDSYNEKIVKKMMTEEWEKIDESLLQRLVDSMVERIKKVIEVDGNITKY